MRVLTLMNQPAHFAVFQLVQHRHPSDCSWMYCAAAAKQGVLGRSTSCLGTCSEDEESDEEDEAESGAEGEEEEDGFEKIKSAKEKKKVCCPYTDVRIKSAHRDWQDCCKQLKSFCATRQLHLSETIIHPDSVGGYQGSCTCAVLIVFGGRAPSQDSNGEQELLHVCSHACPSVKVHKSHHQTLDVIISSTIQDKLLTMDPIIVTCVPIRHVF